MEGTTSGKEDSNEPDYNQDQTVLEYIRETETTKKANQVREGENCFVMCCILYNKKGKLQINDGQQTKVIKIHFVIYSTHPPKRLSVLYCLAEYLACSRI